MLALDHVPSGYAHYAKRAVPRGLVEAPGATLKYYHLERPGEPVPEDVDGLARECLVEPGAIGFNGDYGFCLLHRCGADFHFLLPVVWRGANEAWEAVWYHQGDMTEFRPFDPAYPPKGAPPRPTFCVWELGIVAHESAAWSRFLASDRDEPDLAFWLEDMFEGEV